LWDKLISRTPTYQPAQRDLTIASNMARHRENEQTMRTLRPDIQPIDKRSESVTGCRRKLHGQEGASMKDLIGHNHVSCRTPVPTDLNNGKKQF